MNERAFKCTGCGKTHYPDRFEDGHELVGCCYSSYLGYTKKNQDMIKNGILPDYLRETRPYKFKGGPLDGRTMDLVGAPILKVPCAPNLKVPTRGIDAVIEFDEYGRIKPLIPRLNAVYEVDDCGVYVFQEMES